ncbi:MAG: imidazole glycerol phosphate synthase subunit HisH [Phycisphaeraceae bacterium]|nr:imidazole glycerol phosphate synthase subunit HisH [Phycisphaeraceae bacterium]
MIGIVNYGMGNLRSVQKALQRVGAQAEVIDSPGQIASAKRLILPGVGAFADGMEHLRERGMAEPLKQFADSGKPMLGICLGMQLLFDSSMEDAPSADEPVLGLGILPGKVVRFQEDQGPDKPRLKVPHMGWNEVTFAPDTPLFVGLTPGDHVYFVHGYYCVPDEASDAAATTDYGSTYCSAVHRGNVWATQFHPEKSQRVGLQILENFANAELVHA